MTRRIEVTPPAKQDLDDIYEHVAVDNLTAAGRLIERLTDTYRKLAELPGMGRGRPELGPELRSFVVSPYLIFYRQSEEGIQVLRILHGARDIDETLFFE